MLTVGENKFLMNGKPFQILSGSIHYFRVVPEYWEDRLRKLKACGFNTVESYIPWNIHEPKKGEFQFTGLADLEGFLKIAASLGLYVILRPSPYICAEWEFGGLPGWLLRDKALSIRCSDPKFLEHVSEYYDVLMPKITPYLQSNDGPVIALQIENEYGAYGNDAAYLTFLKEALEQRGADVLLFTSDGPDMIADGSLPDVLTTLNFGSKAEEGFRQLEEFKAGSPKLCCEYWIGWFDHWGGEHHTRSGKDAAEVLDQMLAMGASVNFYMFHGGTNFAFYNGANHYEEYTPTITSYDYDSLLTESGEITEKYKEVKKVLSKYGAITEDNAPETITAAEPRTAEMTESVSLFDTLPSLSERIYHPVPLSMEEAGQNYGYMLYRTTIERPGERTIDTSPIRDRAFIYINGVYQKTVYRNDKEKSITLSFPESVNKLEILVENMGRVNYGKNMMDRKGLIENLWIDNQYMFGWEMFPIELEKLDVSFAGNGDSRFPRFYKSEIELEETADTFINLDGWKKGSVFINGFNLGRYWEIGPQKTLYAPGPLFRKGKNEILVLELEGTVSNTITLDSKPDLG